MIVGMKIGKILGSKAISNPDYQGRKKWKTYSWRQKKLSQKLLNLYNWKEKQFFGKCSASDMLVLTIVNSPLPLPCRKHLLGTQ